MNPASLVLMKYLFTIPTTLTLIVFVLLFDISPQPGRDDLLMLSIAIVAILAAVLFLPLRSAREADVIKSTLTNAALVAAILVGVVLLLPGLMSDWVSLIRMTMTCYLLMATALLLLVIVPGKIERNRSFVAVGFVALLAVPVWLGSVTELAGNPATLTNLVVAVSPLSAFAAALDIDILRTKWFYEHSALGSLRYEYLAWSNYIVVLSTLSFIFAAAGRRSYKRL